MESGVSGRIDRYEHRLATAASQAARNHRASPRCRLLTAAPHAAEFAQPGMAAHIPAV